MKEPPYALSYELLCLQLADDGREASLLGNSAQRARKAAQAFLLGDDFPDIYFEFPLVGDPFLDVTILYGDIGEDSHIASDAAPDTDRILAWYSPARRAHPEITCGFELDTKHEELPAAAIHFQPRSHHELVEPFCTAIGEPERAQLYLDLAHRMPDGWPLSFFGMFRGRPGSPLRVCGYLGGNEQRACARSPRHIAEIFEQVGFADYDDDMLERISALLAINAKGADFQFDIYPDGRIGDTFAIDVSFEVKQPETVRESFEKGIAAQLMGLLEQWGAADERWRLAADAAFARAIPVELEDGSTGAYAFTLIPQWVKARWSAGVQQPSKLYYLGHAGRLGEEDA